MVQTMIPKSLRAMKLYFTTVYQEIWVGLAITAYAYYKISYGGYAEKIPNQTLSNEMLQAVGKVDREKKPSLWEQLSDIASVFFQLGANNAKKQWQISPLAIIKDLFSCWNMNLVVRHLYCK